MPDEISAGKRDLIARVATLELVVADLIHELWRLDASGMEKLADEAAHDLEIQHSRISLPVGEHQRERLYTVLETRRRMLRRKTSEG
jgi:hypothetical protein